MLFGQLILMINLRYVSFVDKNFAEYDGDINFNADKDEQNIHISNTLVAIKFIVVATLAYGL